MSRQDYTYCVITATKPVGKKIDADLNKTPLPVYTGTAENYISTVAEFGEHLEEMTTHECMTVGTPKVNKCHLTTKGRQQPGAERRGVPILAKTNDNWVLPNDPGFVVFDHDVDHWTQGDVDSPEALVTLLGEALGVDLAEFDYVVKPSSSSYIELDGVEVVGLRGQHLYLGVTNLADLDSGALEGIAFQNGFGCGVISKSGGLLKRGLFDAAMHKAPSQPVFSGPPTFTGGHVSRAQDHILVNEGRPLDLRVLQATLRQERADAAWEAIRVDLGGVAAEAFETYVTEREAAGLSREAVQSAVGGELPGGWPIVFDDGTSVPLWQIIQTPLAYNGRVDVRDPLEPDYGPSKAKIYIDSGSVTIHSMAHGGRTFNCFMDIESLVMAIQGSDALKEDWAPLISLLGGAYKVGEVVDALKEGGVDETKTALKERVKRLQRQAATARAKAGDWAAKYAFLSQDGKFVNLPTLARHHLMITMPVFSFNIVHAKMSGPNGESPAAWLTSSGVIPSFERVISSPPEDLGGALPAVEGALNIWQPGPVIERFDAEPMLWLQLLHRLVPVEEERENFLDWMAFQLQHPGLKCNWQIMMYGQQGVGKDSLLYPLRYGMGHHNTVDVTTSELLGDFHHYLAGGPKLMVLQEIDAGHKTAMQNKLKPLAAAPPMTHMVNQKGLLPVYIDNNQALVVTTNSVHPVSLDKGDRRWYMLESPGEPLPAAFFKQLWGWYLGGGVRAVAGWLAARDLSAFDPDVLPGDTEYKRTVIELSQTSYHMAVRDFIERTGCTVTKLDWMLAAVKMGGEQLSRRQLALALTDLGWKAVEPTKRINGVVKKARGWVAPGFELQGGALFDAIGKVETLNI